MGTENICCTGGRQGGKQAHIIKRLSSANSGLQKACEEQLQEIEELKRKASELERALEQLAVVIDDGVHCDDCKACVECFKRPSKSCKDSIVDWAKQKAKKDMTK